MSLKVANVAEEIQDYIANNSDLDLVVGTASANFTLGDVLDIGDIESYLTEKVILAMYDEGGDPAHTHRKDRYERTFRFIYKGTYGQEAIDRCWSLVRFFRMNRKFLTTTYSVWLYIEDKLPSLIAANRSGTYLADIVVTFLVSQRSE